MGSYLSIITLNVNGLNDPTKRQSLAEWIQKQDLYICCLQETHFKPRDTDRLKVKGNFKFVPYLDYTTEWTDAQLFAKYNCTEDEIDMIESIMRPLEYVLHKDTGSEKNSLYGNIDEEA